MTTKTVRAKLTMKRSKRVGEKGEFQIFDLFFKGKELMSHLTVFTDGSIELANYKEHGYETIIVGVETIES